MRKKDKVATRDETDNLESLISLAIHLDNHLKDRHREKKGCLKGPSPDSQSHSLPCVFSGNPHSSGPSHLPPPPGGYYKAGQSLPNPHANNKLR